MDETSGSQTDAQQAPGPVGLTEQQLDELRAMFDVARSGDVRLAEWVDQGLPVNLTNESGDTLLILACYHRHHDLAAALVARGADLERVNELARRPWAAPSSDRTRHSSPCCWRPARTPTPGASRPGPSRTSSG